MKEFEETKAFDYFLGADFFSFHIYIETRAEESWRWGFPLREC